MQRTSATVSKNLFAFGSAHFLREVVVPLSAEVEGIAKQYPTDPEDAAWDPKLPVNPQADIALVAGLVVVVTFVGSWGAKKALDEIYEKLGPPLRRAIGIFLQ